MIENSKGNDILVFMTGQEDHYNNRYLSQI